MTATDVGGSETRVVRNFLAVKVVAFGLAKRSSVTILRRGGGACMRNARFYSSTESGAAGMVAA